MSDLTPDEVLRYSRHLSLPQVGAEGQEKLKHASVVIIGAGGLGSPAALYLAAAGVGKLGLVDFDRVDATNLQRQVIHGTSTIGVSKLDSAAARIHDLNPLVEVVPHRERITSENAFDILRPYEIVIDGTDNFPTRYLVNDACVMLKKPNVYGSVFRFEGQASVFAPGGPCYRCMYPEPPPAGTVPSCEEGGVLGVVPGIIGLLQTNEAIKLILGVGQTLAGRLLLFDALAMRFREMRIPRNEDCVVCGTHPRIRELIDYEVFCGVSPVTEKNDEDLAPRQLVERYAKGNRPRLIDVREQWEWDLARLEGAELIPLSTIPRSTDRLQRDEEIVVYCRTGRRSAEAKRYLQQHGFARVRNLVGGIEQWLREGHGHVEK